MENPVEAPKQYFLKSSSGDTVEFQKSHLKLFDKILSRFTHTDCLDVEYSTKTLNILHDYLEFYCELSKSNRDAMAKVGFLSGMDETYRDMYVFCIKLIPDLETFDEIKQFCDEFAELCNLEYIIAMFLVERILNDPASIRDYLNKGYEIDDTSLSFVEDIASNWSGNTF